MFLVCGEALFDFFLESEAGPAAATYAARAGGSPFNVAIGLARLGHASGLLTGLSDDLLGQRLAAGARRRGRLDRLRHPDRPADHAQPGRPRHPRGAGLPVLRQRLGRHRRRRGRPAAGSGRRSPACTSAPTRWRRRRSPTPSRRSPVPTRDRFISLDPNVRPTVEPDMDVWRERLAVLFPLADVVKISAEDLEIAVARTHQRASRRRPDRPGGAAGGGHRRRRGGAGLDGLGAACDGGAAAGRR